MEEDTRNDGDQHAGAEDLFLNGSSVLCAQNLQ